MVFFVSGTSWTKPFELNPVYQWKSVSMSSSGQYVTWMTSNSPPQVLLSDTYGLSISSGYAFGFNDAGAYAALDMSSSGIYQFVVTNNGYFSFFNLSVGDTNSYLKYGWTRDAPVPFPAKWSAVTCSGDGSRVYAAVNSSLTVGGPLVFYSTNYSLFKIDSVGANAVWTATINSG